MDYLLSCFNFFPTQTTNSSTPLIQQNAQPTQRVQTKTLTPEAEDTKKCCMEAVEKIFVYVKNNPDEFIRIHCDEEDSEVIELQQKRIFHSMLAPLRSGSYAYAQAMSFSLSGRTLSTDVIGFKEVDGGMDIYSQKYNVLNKVSEEKYIGRVENLTLKKLDNLSAELNK